MNVIDFLNTVAFFKEKQDNERKQMDKAIQDARYRS